MDENQIYKQLDKIKEIPTLPTIVFELNQHLQNPETSIARVRETIEKDQAMALKTSRRGFGLASMRERAELSGAAFEINSIIGRGTTVRAVWTD